MREATGLGDEMTWIDRFHAMSVADAVQTIAEDPSTLVALVREAQAVTTATAGAGMTLQQHEKAIAGLTLENRQIKNVLGTLLAWLPYSANSPIRPDEASRLLNILYGHED